MGYDSNPLFESPMKKDWRLQNYSYLRENLIYHVLSGSICLIQGRRSSGKTTLLKHIINEVRGQRKIVYIDLMKVSKRVDLEKVIDKQRGALDRLFRRKMDGMVLLLDNAQDLTKRNFEKLHYYFDRKVFHSIVIASKDKNGMKMPKSLSDRIGKRVFSTQELDRTEAVDMVKDKLEGKEVLKDYQIEVLYVMADKDIRRFLVYLDMVISHAVENPDETLSSKKIASIVDKVKVSDEDLPEEHDRCECGSELIFLGGSYRCPSCDTFCYGCGAIVHEDDGKCPSCGKGFEGVA